jgi:hypothetical protein
VHSTTRFLAEPEGLRYNGGALAYAVIGYAAGFAGLFHSAWAVNLVATVLLAHAMTIAAYLIHECAHNLVFRNARHNAALGRFLAWLCGAAYGTFEDMSPMSPGSITRDSLRSIPTFSKRHGFSSGSTSRLTS